MRHLLSLSRKVRDVWRVPDSGTALYPQQNNLDEYYAMISAWVMIYSVTRTASIRHLPDPSKKASQH